MFWYDILCKTIYGKEKIKDNRVRTFEKRLRTFDREVEPKKLHLCMRIRQKAVYSPEGITRKEAEAANRNLYGRKQYYYRDLQRA